MRILVICSAPPRTDANTMGIQQTFHRLRKLSGEHEFTIAYTNRDRVPEPQPSDVPFQLVRLPDPVPRESVAFNSRPRVYWQVHAWQQAIFGRAPQIYSERRNPALAQTIAQLVAARAPELVHVIGEPMLFNTPRACPRVLADFPDLFSILFARVDGATLRRRSRRWQHAREIQKIRRVESEILSRASVALFVSETDRAAAQQLAPAARTFVVPNAVDMEFFRPVDEAEQADSILFTGTLSYAPNIQALEFFAREIFPRIHAAIPAATLNIVGYKPAPQILALQSETVRVHANVPDVRPFLARAAVCVAPILSGSGTRIKIIEAWAMRKAVVSTRIGAEGLDAQDGTHLLLRDEAKTFAEAVNDLLRDAARRRALGEAGCRLAAERYSMARAAKELNHVYHTVARDSS